MNVVRERFFKPRRRFPNVAEMNAWLLEQCVAYARTHPHPECRDRLVWEMLEAERPHLVRYVGPFGAFHSNTASVSKTCLVPFDRNKYSVMSQAVARPVEVHAGACPRAGLRPEPGPSALWSARMAWLSRSTSAALAAIRPCMTRGTLCPC